MPVDIEFLKSIGLDDESVAEKIAAKVSEEEKGLISKRDELLGKVTKYGEEMKRFEGIDPDEYKTMRERLEELSSKDLTAEERAKLERKKVEEEYKSKIAEIEAGKQTVEQQLAEMKNAIRDKEQSNAVLSAVGDKGDGELILDVIKVRGLIETIEEDGKERLKVYSVDKSKELPKIEALLEEMKASDKYSRLFNSSGLSGGGARPNKSGAGSQDNDGLIGAARIRAARGS